MSTSRIFRASMSLFACTALFMAMTSGSSAANSQSTGGKTASGSPAPTGPVKLKVADYSVNFGGRFNLRGKTGAARKGHVRIQSRVNGRWHNLRKAGTDGMGRYRLKLRARHNLVIRAVAGDGRVSKTRRVTVIGHIRLDRSERYVKLGRKLRVSGVVVPRGVRTVKVRVRGEGVMRTRSRANGRFAFRWTPRRNGDFSYRVWARKSRKSTGDSSRPHRFSALRPGEASYYGPGLYGNGVACGGTLTPTTRGVANKYLPCGTRVTLQYGNRTVVVRVIDRGPYGAGRDWDLTEQTKKDLGFGGVGTVWTNK